MRDGMAFIFRAINNQLPGADLRWFIIRWCVVFVHYCKALKRFVEVLRSFVVRNVESFL
jgi:hypothetical protein